MFGAHNDITPSIGDPTSVSLALGRSATINAMMADDQMTYRGIETARSIKQNFTNDRMKFSPGKALVPTKPDIYQHRSQGSVEPIFHGGVFLKDARVRYTAEDMVRIKDEERSHITMAPMDSRINKVVNMRVKLSEADRQKVLDQNPLQRRRDQLAVSMQKGATIGRNKGLTRASAAPNVIFGATKAERGPEMDTPYELVVRASAPKTLAVDRYGGIQASPGDAHMIASQRRLEAPPLAPTMVEEEPAVRFSKARYTAHKEPTDEIREVLPTLLDDLAMSDARLQTMMLGQVDMRMLQELRQVIEERIIVQNDVYPESIQRAINVYKSLPKDEQIEVLSFALDRYASFIRVRNILREYPTDAVDKVYRLLNDLGQDKYVRLQQVLHSLPDEQQEFLDHYILDFINHALVSTTKQPELKWYLNEQLNDADRALQMVPTIKREEVLKILRLYASRLQSVAPSKAEYFFNFINDVPVKLAFQRREVLKQFFDERPEEVIYGMDNDVGTVRMMQVGNTKQVIICTPEEVVSYIVPDADIIRFVKAHRGNEAFLKSLSAREQAHLVLRYIERDVHQARVIPMNVMAAAMKMARYERLDEVVELATYINDNYGHHFKINPTAAYRVIMDSKDPVILQHLSRDTDRAPKKLTAANIVHSRKVGASAMTSEYDSLGQI